ncbi:unnamed protein product [Moneuplotes crassus]|uniref:Lebercilin domain-containing protein n=1 Tax=Euplotes crassus TaxID=5936 RepID=A0AAD1XC00_EUPCR|nr:unnamed protein product [Moneuplotes crassus]
MSVRSLHRTTEESVEKPLENYNRRATEIYNEDNLNQVSSSIKINQNKPHSKRSPKKKVVTKSIIIDKMKELNNKARDQLKSLNSNLEHILESMKYKIMHKQQIEEREIIETPEHKLQVVESEILQLQKQKKQLLIDQEHWNKRLKDTTTYKPQPVEEKEKNNEMLKQTIRELKKEIKEQEKLLVSKSNPAEVTYKTNEVNEKYLRTRNKNLKLETQIQKQEESLLQHENLLQRNLAHKLEVQKSIEVLEVKIKKRAESRLKRKETNNPETPKQETKEELLVKIQEISLKISQDDKQFALKKSKMNNKLSEKQKQLQYEKLRLKEKDQERRIGNLKVQELRRIIKQQKLQPLISKKDKFREQIRTGRNKSLRVNNTQPAISKTIEKEDEKPYIDQDNPGILKKEDSKGSSNFRLAKVEWRYNGEKLHRSSVDLREKTPAVGARNNTPTHSNNKNASIVIDKSAKTTEKKTLKKRPSLKNMTPKKELSNLRVEQEKVSHTGGSALDEFYQNTDE